MHLQPDTHLQPPTPIFSHPHPFAATHTHIIIQPPTHMYIQETHHQKPPITHLKSSTSNQFTITLYCHLPYPSTVINTDIAAPHLGQLLVPTVIHTRLYKSTSYRDSHFIFSYLHSYTHPSIAIHTHLQNLYP